MGKAELLQRFCAPSPLQSTCAPVLQVPHEGGRYPLQFRVGVLGSPLEGAHAALLLYDLTRRDTFTPLCSAYPSTLGTPLVPCLLLGTHLDARDDREVPQRQAQGWAQSARIPALELSALTGEGVAPFLHTLLTLLLTHQTNCFRELGLLPATESSQASLSVPSSPPDRTGGALALRALFTPPPPTSPASPAPAPSYHPALARTVESSAPPVPSPSPTPEVALTRTRSESRAKEVDPYSTAQIKRFY